jgi:hypothetical protein
MPAKTKPNKSPKGTVTPIRDLPVGSYFRDQKVSVWRFWDHGVTSSLIDRFQECTKQCERHAT